MTTVGIRFRNVKITYADKCRINHKQMCTYNITYNYILFKLSFHLNDLRCILLNYFHT